MTGRSLVLLILYMFDNGLQIITASVNISQSVKVSCAVSAISSFLYIVI